MDKLDIGRMEYESACIPLIGKLSLPSPALSPVWRWRQKQRPGRRLSIRLPDAIGGERRARPPAMAIPALPSGVMVCLHFALTSSLILLILSCCLIQSLERAWQMRETRTKASWLAGAILS